MYLASHLFQLLDVDDDLSKKIEKLTIILYDETSSLRSINDTKRQLFCHKNRTMDKLPPTNDAVLQHVRRAVYQAGIWTTSTQTQLVIPSPHDFTWAKILDSWVPGWVTISEASRACRELINCSCKGNCSICQCAKNKSSLLTTLQVQM